ncbi:MAG: SDR family NAD(P)-dependent oxidoreductase [Candidatus Kariarchaeaceae archaeon]|jgi:NAD(P)-dependent dehydrogenase (short-subunit alcohol dehydrogenase family)
MVKTAIVTGGNRGLGFEICKQLAQLEYNVILTSRTLERGSKAVRALNEINLDANLHILDLDSKDSIGTFVEEINNTYEQVDLLYHNAAILPEIDRSIPISNVKIEDFENTMQTNFLGPLYLTQLILHLMPPKSRIINIAARPSLFRFFAENGRMPAYRISKLAFHAMTVLLAEELKEREITVVAVHPGWVRTDMGGSNAMRSLEEGAETPIWLANEDINIVSGVMYLDKDVIEW